MASGARLTLDEARFNRAVQTFLRRQAPQAVDRAARRVAFGVGVRIVRSLNGLDGLPKRVDTGRYRAAWAVGTSQATGRRVAAPPASTSEPGDGIGTREGRGLTLTLTVTNNVEYGEHVENGTERMAAGLHRAAALEAEGRKVAATVGGEIARAWEA